MSGRDAFLPQGARLREGDVPVHRGIKKAWRIALYVSLAALSILLWRPLSRLLFQIFLALGLSMAALPVCKFYEKKAPRALSCLLAVLTLLLFAAGFVALFIPPLVSQMRLVIDEIPRLLSWAQGMLNRLRQNSFFQGLGLGVSPDAPSQMLSTVGKWLTDQAPRVLGALLGTVEKVSQAFISPVLCYYFLRDRETFCYQLSLWIPLRHRKRVLVAMREMRREAGSYIRGQALVALCVGALTAAGLFVIGTPAWLVLGLLMGLCEVIPYVGPIIGSVPIILFTLPQGMTQALWALGVTVAVQQLESIVIAPRLMAGATGLHPVYIILLLTAGSMLLGLIGMLLALPVFVCLRGFLRVFLGGSSSPPPQPGDGALPFPPQQED